MSEGFRFRKFYVRHDRSSMPVGTDGVLLGAWCPITGLFASGKEERHILDIGSGSGLIALMLAQRIDEANTGELIDWHIDAIDIDFSSVEQAASNFASSPWKEHLRVCQSRVQEWEGKYDLLVSNPPFFISSLHNPDLQRATARQADISLPLSELMSSAVRLMTDDGVFALVIPALDEDRWLREAEANQMKVCGRCEVRGKSSLPLKRILLALRKQGASENNGEKAGLPSELVLTDDRGKRSEDYQRLTESFYL